METATVHELIGYVGSAFVVLSLMMRSLLRLRWVNIVGATVFALYGVLIAAPPVWIMNGTIVLIDVWHLRRMLGGEEDLEVLEVASSSTYLARFLAYHAGDIRRFQPAFDGVRDEHRAFMILRDLVPAAVVLVRRAGRDRWHVDLDYAIPAYRDHTSGGHAYRDGELFRTLGARELVSDPGSADHRRYLDRMGFREEGGRYHLARPAA